MLRKAAIAGAFPDAAIVISAMAFLPPDRVTPGRVFV